MLRRLLSYLLFDNNRNITVLLNSSSIITQSSLRDFYRQRFQRVSHHAEILGKTRLCLCGVGGFLGMGFFVIWAEIV
jgi:hypothetical protein